MVYMLRLIESRNDDVIAVEISEKVTRKDYQEIEGAFQKLVDRHGKIKVLLTLGDYTGFSMDVFLAKLDFIKKFYRYCDRIAFVSNRNWLANIVDIEKHFIKANVKHFEPAQQDEAWSWLAEK
ncbi:STAS/SEC14 domain-containing protein [Brevibacillus fluminis]|uniref:STAS/SEC14 domain-containing protein n=2 Tax=Brevibacillus fluminis TaxID=511487 RepID=A0A3M8CWQ0_9BACL|nr:STAS/SEC14 domain-containing protein [Brevibacillus fluminis]